jgi:hypothetical protein
MEVKHLLKRVLLDLAVIAAVVVLALGCLYVYVWIKVRPLRGEARAEPAASLAKMEARHKALIELGSVSLESPNLSLAELQLKLHQPTLSRAGSKNTTTLGWACAGELCTIFASFLVPFGQEIPPSTVPAALLMVDPLFKDVGELAIGGVHLGESVDEVKAYCQKNGYGQETGYHRMTWDKHWTLSWGEMNGKITVVSFGNDKLIGSVRGGAVSSVIGTPEEKTAN